MHLKIGGFARLAHVSLKTLHHYDAIGLLQPAQVDRFTSYRYYTLEQLPRLNRVLALRDLGFTVAYAVYHGSYDDFAAVGALHAAIRRWIEENGWQPGEAVREYYLQPPPSPHERQGVMEIQYPLI